MKSKRIALALSMSLCLLMVPINVSAITLDEITTEQTATTETVEQTTLPVESTETTLLMKGNILDEVQSAMDLGAPTEAVNKINSLINKVASFIIQVLSYFITAFLVVRVLADICYIVIPFSRAILSNGHTSRIYQNNPMNVTQQGNAGLDGQMSSSINMVDMQQNMQANNQHSIQWVSTAALNAVAREQMIGKYGKIHNVLKYYACDMVVVLVLTAILLTLAITGVLTDLGFVLGEMIAEAISKIDKLI